MSHPWLPIILLFVLTVVGAYFYIFVSYKLYARLESKIETFYRLHAKPSPFSIEKPTTLEDAEFNSWVEEHRHDTSLLTLQRAYFAGRSHERHAMFQKIPDYWIEVEKKRLEGA